MEYFRVSGAPPIFRNIQGPVLRNQNSNATIFKMDGKKPWELTFPSCLVVISPIFLELKTQILPVLEVQRCKIYVRCIRGPALRNQYNIQTHTIWLIFMVNVCHKYSGPMECRGKFHELQSGTVKNGAPKSLLK